MRRIKLLLFRLMGKEPQSVVVTFASGPPELVRKVEAEIRALEPHRRHFTIQPRAGSSWKIYLELRREFRHLRIGIAPVLFTAEASPLRMAGVTNLSVPTGPHQ